MNLMTAVGKTLAKDPNLNIFGYTESGTEVLLYVSSYNERNLALNNRVIEGKKVTVVVAA